MEKILHSDMHWTSGKLLPKTFLKIKYPQKSKKIMRRNMFKLFFSSREFSFAVCCRRQMPEMWESISCVSAPRKNLREKAEKEEEIVVKAALKLLREKKRFIRSWTAVV